MTDPPIDNTQAREQDAPGTHDAKQRAPVHGHTGDVPSDKALSDRALANRAGTWHLARTRTRTRQREVQAPSELEQCWNTNLG
eukprot:scaffold8644_cov115-Isochrysis_galbana.AAC.1